jgi:hypothetical protein
MIAAAFVRDQSFPVRRMTLSDVERLAKRKRNHRNKKAYHPANKLPAPIANFVGERMRRLVARMVTNKTYSIWKQV